MPDRGDHFDLVVLGAGPAGEKGAAQAAYFGKRVAVIEREPEPGGAAVHTGTLPSKTLRETALYLAGHRARELYGVAVELSRDATVPLLMSRRDAIVRAESLAVTENLERHRIERIRGHARFLDPHTVLATRDGSERRVRGDVILIATGSRPCRPAEIDFSHERIHDSDEILHITALPASIAVLGGGVIGCEYACMFAALGVPVTVVDARPEILPFLDLEILGRLKASMGQLGIRLIQGQRWTRVAAESDRVVVTLRDGGAIAADHLIFAAGRTGATTGLGLERVGLAPDVRGCLAVDRCFRTAVPHILAAGDVIGFPSLASVAMEQGRVAVCHAFGFEYKQAVSALMPYGIYTIPEVSACGETEESCREKGIDYVAGRALFRNNPRGRITGDLEGLTKLVVDAATRRLLGVHIMGERATELVHIGQTAIALGGTVDTFIDMVFNYPTLADTYKYAAYACLDALNRRGE